MIGFFPSFLDFTLSYLVDELANQVRGGAHVDTRRVGVLRKPIHVLVCTMYVYVEDIHACTWQQPIFVYFIIII